MAAINIFSEEIRALRRALKKDYNEKKQILFEGIDIELQALKCNTRLNYAWMSFCAVVNSAKMGLECWGAGHENCKVQKICQILAQGDTFDLWKLKKLVEYCKPAYPVWKKYNRRW